MKNKILSFLLCAALIFTLLPTYALADTVTFIDTDFEDYEGNATGTKNPDGFSGGTVAFEGPESSYQGYFAVSTEKGTSVSMESNRVAWHEMVKSLGTNVTSALEISVDINLRDKNVSRTLMVRGTNKDGADQWERSMITINKTTGDVLFDGVNSGYSLSVDTWYTLKFIYNIATKFCLGQVLNDGGEVLAERYFVTTYGANKIASVYFNYIQSSMTAGTLAKTYIDNYCIKQIPSFGIEVEKSFDFTAFSPSADGQSAPEGLTIEGGVADTNGLFSEDGKTILRSAGVSYVFPMDVVGEYSIMANIIPKDFTGDVSFGFGNDKPFLTFKGENGKIFAGTSEIGTYEPEKEYSLSCQADTVTGKVKVTVSSEDGEISAEGTLPSGVTKFSKIGIYTTCDTVLNSAGIYSVNVLTCSKITPCDDSWRVIPEDTIYLEFTNNIASFDEVLIGGDVLDTAYIEDGKKIAIPNDGKFDFNKTVKISITDIVDIFGNKVNLIKDVTVAPKEEIKPITLKITSGIANATSGIRINDDSVKEAYLILATFGSDAVLSSVKTQYVNASYGENPLSLSASVPDGGFAESYLWSGFENINFLAEKAVAGEVNLRNEDNTSVAPSFKVNRDSAEILAGGIGISEGKSVIIVLKDGKTLENLKLNPDASIAYIREMGTEYEKKGHLISLGSLSGTFKIAYQSGKTGDWGFLEEGVTLYSSSEVSSAKSLINASNPDYDSIIMGAFAPVLGVDNSEYSTLGDKKVDLLAEITSERAKMEGGVFSGVTAFADTYYKALSRAYVNGNATPDKVKELFEKYEKELYVDAFSSFDTYKNLSDSAKGSMFSSIAKGTYEDFASLNKAFDRFAVLSAITSAQYSSDITDILDKNKGILEIDLSVYESLINPLSVNASLYGVVYESLEEFKTAFENAVSAQYRKEHTPAEPQRPQGGGGGGGGMSFTPNETPMPTAAPKSTFSDLGSVPWAKDAIETLYAKGIISGKSEKNFCPDDFVTREEFAKLLICAFYPKVPESDVYFSDVEKNAWYYKFIAASYKMGIISGRENGIFGTGENIKREDMAVMAARAMGIGMGDTASLSDFAEISDYAKGAVSALYKKDIIKGKADGVFAPKDNATRAESAVIIYRILETGVSK